MPLLGALLIELISVNTANDTYLAPIVSILTRHEVAIVDTMPDQCLIGDIPNRGITSHNAMSYLVDKH